MSNNNLNLLKLNQINNDQFIYSKNLLTLASEKKNNEWSHLATLKTTCSKQFYCFKSSNFSLISSNNLSALNLETIDSVSVYSFQRKSLHSDESDSELNSICLLDTSTNSNQINALISEDDLKTRANHKVENWLKNNQIS